jgi:hypothetical protein
MSSVNQTVADWARITVERWEEKITTLKIGDSNTLLRSFTHQVISDSNGDPEMIKFTFEYYGRLVDMGVGRGVTAADVGVKETRRRPKPWYNKTFGREIHRLGELLAEAYGRKAVTIIVNQIEGK